MPETFGSGSNSFSPGRQERHYAFGTAGAAEGTRRRRGYRHALAVLQASQDHAQKKTAHAAEQRRSTVNAAREAWFEGQLDLDPTRIVFIDETAANTKMARPYGRAPRGERCRAPVPHGHWKTTTFTAGLRHDGIAAPMVLDGPMNGEAFLAYIKQALVPELRPGDIVIMDNLPAHKVHGVRQAIEAGGASLASPPTCRPTAPTSIPSKWPAPNSRLSCAPPPPVQSQTSGKPSPTPFAALLRKNAPTTSPPLDTMQRERKML